MSDAELRELEQRCSASPSEELEVELLRVRVRAGVLSEERLKVARLLGHGPSRRACEDAAFLELSERLERLAELEAAELAAPTWGTVVGRAREARREFEASTRAAICALVEAQSARYQEPAQAHLLRSLLVTWLCPAAAFRIVIAGLRAAGHSGGQDTKLIQLLLNRSVPFEDTDFMADYQREEHARLVAAAWSVATVEKVRAEVLPWALGMEPLESRHNADDVFGDVAPYRRGNG